jgi:flagellar basal-body rod protein FlgC
MAGLEDAFLIGSSGIRAQGDRLRVVAQNLANADSTGETPGALPYQRKTISFHMELDRATGASTVAARYGVDKTPFKKKYDPSHPAADAQGYVLYPNVDRPVELVDTKEAQRAYEAMVNTVDITQNLISQTLGIIK